MLLPFTANSPPHTQNQLHMMPCSFALSMSNRQPFSERVTIFLVPAADAAVMNLLPWGLYWWAPG